VTETTLRAVLWDLDGTVLDSRGVHWDAWRIFCEEQGRPMTFQSFNDTFGFRNEIILRRHFGPQLTAADVERMGLAKETLYRDLLRRTGVKPLPGVCEWMRWARKHSRPQALASMAPRENIEVTLAALQMLDTFQAIVSSEEVRHGKPDPEVFLLAADRLAVPPARCTVIEDSPQGVEAARRAGMRSIGVGPLYETLEADVRLLALAGADPASLI
jgi:beta-phosphoglucomutase